MGSGHEAETPAEKLGAEVTVACGASGSGDYFWNWYWNWNVSPFIDLCALYSWTPQFSFTSRFAHQSAASAASVARTSGSASVSAASTDPPKGLPRSESQQVCSHVSS